MAPGFSCPLLNQEAPGTGIPARPFCSLAPSCSWAMLVSLVLELSSRTARWLICCCEAFFSVPVTVIVEPGAACRGVMLVMVSATRSPGSAALSFPTGYAQDIISMPVPDRDLPTERQLQAAAELLAAVSPLGDLFAKAGHELALVGGPVRDVYLGRRSQDLDLTTDA